MSRLETMPLEFWEALLHPEIPNFRGVTLDDDADGNQTIRSVYHPDIPQGKTAEVKPSPSDQLARLVLSRFAKLEGFDDVNVVAAIEAARESVRIVTPFIEYEANRHQIDQLIAQAEKLKPVTRPGRPEISFDALTWLRSLREKFEK